MFTEILKASRNHRAAVLTEITAAQNEVALSYHRVRGLHLVAVILAAPIIVSLHLLSNSNFHVINNTNLI